MSLFIFPRWANKTKHIAGVALAGAPVYLTAFVWYGFSPKTTDVGYMPNQPVPYSHALHAGELGIDCRYCHNTVEKTGMAAIPANATCMNCHKMIHTKSPNLLLVRESAATNKSIEWLKVHDLPDYVYFNHSAHVTRGVGCVSCHGRVDQMAVVYQKETLSMGWCLDCHRAPEQNLRPPETATQMEWKPPNNEDPIAFGTKFRAANHINPPTDCSTCHR
jgi:menaquinone reductase, multiheme cytochrome c subunit